MALQDGKWINGVNLGFWEFQGCVVEQISAFQGMFQKGWRDECRVKIVTNFNKPNRLRLNFVNRTIKVPTYFQLKNTLLRV